MILAVDTVRPSRPFAGQVWLQSIEEILADFSSCDDGLCCDCGDECVGGWECTLAGKRRDGNYPDVLASIRDRGFVRPLVVYTIHAGYWMFGDGHHRLAAAIELGMTHVPVEYRPDQYVELRDERWHYDDSIPLFNSHPEVPRF